MAIIGRHDEFTVKTVRNKVWRFEVHNSAGMIVMTTNEIDEVLRYLNVTELRTHPRHNGFSYVIGYYRLDINRNRLAGVLFGRNTQTKSHCEQSCRSAYGPYDHGTLYEPIRVNHGVGLYVTEALASQITEAEQSAYHNEMMQEWLESELDA